MTLQRKFNSPFFGLLLAAAMGLPAAGMAQATGLAAADSAVNSKYNEIKPLVSPDGSTLYFTRSNHPLNSGGRRDKGDIWRANILPDGSWSKAERAPDVFNSSQLNMVIGFSADGKSIYYQTYDPETKGKRQAGIKKTGANGGSASTVNIHYFFNGAKYQDATVSPDGKVMLLSMESYSTYGLEDLYVSFLQPDGSWSEPKNLGQDINTEKQEMGAWLAADGQTLFFTSNGHGGSGSMDVFRTTRQDGSWKRWSKPENLGSSVNSAGADLYYSEGPQGKWAYFSSTQNSEGYGDIQKIPIPERDTPEPAEEPLVVAEATEQVSELPAEQPVSESIGEADVTVVAKQSFDLQGRVLNEKGALQTASIRIVRPAGNYKEEAATSGTFNLSLPEPGEYKVLVQAPGYYAKDTLLQISEGANTLDFNLKPIVVGETVRLQNVMFRQSTAVLMEESNEALDEVVEMMKSNPQMEIQLTGHTDNQGNSRANIKLSRERVEAVKNYMISRGIDEGRIQGKGFGGTKPVASNASEETRRLNRRVEFVVLKK